MRITKGTKENWTWPRAVGKGRKLLIVSSLCILALYHVAELPLDMSVDYSIFLKDDADIQVFIGIKTSIKGVHGDRVPQIQSTWLQDVVARPQVDLKFFADSNQNATDPSYKSWIIQTPSCTKYATQHALCCKDELMYKYYYENYESSISSSSPFSPWFCAFDDDNYVLVDNLLNLLRSYRPDNGTKIYVGRATAPNGFFIPHLNTRVQFLNTGAGYCVSKELMEFGRAKFSNFFGLCKSIRMPNDMAIGYLVNHQLGIRQISDKHFNSHFENTGRLAPDEIPKQISFAYNNKKKREEGEQQFPKIPILYPA